MAELWGGTPLTLTNLPAGIVCTATVMDYEGHAGDSNHSDEFASPRTVTVRLVRDDAATVISRTWHIYSHATNTYATVTRLTIRAHSATAAIGDSGNAVTTETVFDSDAPGVPLLLRGRPLSATDENGVTTSYEYALGTFDAATRTFTVSSVGPHLRTVSMRTTAAAPVGIAGKSVKNLTIQDATHGVTLHSATLAILPDWSLSEAFDWQTHAYDDKNRLRSTRYADGSSSTNVYSCCRLLWTMDRDGNKVLRSAVTGSDHLYHAMEEVSLRELTEADPFYYAPARYFRVTQHFMDALGRETNTTVRTSRFEGTATVPGFTSPAYPCFTDTTIYPDGTSDYRVHTNRRGVRSVSWNTSLPDREEQVTQTFHPTNLTAYVLLVSNVTWRSGHSLIARSWADGWTRETHLTDYTDEGCRRELAITTASDMLSVVTNSVTLYDFLGRPVSTATPAPGGTWLITTNSYAGATSRLVRSEAAGLPPVTYTFDALGDPVGTTRSGITVASDTRYESISNEVWRVTTGTTAAQGVTNATETTREQMTGLSAALRGRTVTVSADGAVTTVERSFNPTTKTETTTISAMPKYL